ncbi:unnamed protein product [Closterium sp. Naga37s-1]|nr:unnamed protein product [Closterium sp. Naga37s-1]
MYHRQLSYCITQFVEKDPNLADSVLVGLLEFWPLSNSQNELLFLEELEKILELTQELEFHLVMTPLFQQIALCLSSSNFQKPLVMMQLFQLCHSSSHEAPTQLQVVERTLRLWSNDYIVALVAQNQDTILPLIVSALECAESHQNQVEHGIQHHTTNGKKVSTDACVNHDQILSLHRKVKAAIKKYLDDTPDDQLPSWDEHYQGWVFGPTGTVVISGSGFPNHIPDGADPDKRDKEEAEVLVKYCRMQAAKDEAKKSRQAQSDGRDDEDDEEGNWMDEGDDEY